jgi:hypothetical protein
MIVDPSTVVITAHVVAWADDEIERQAWLAECLARHDNGDWGDLDHDGQAANQLALRRHEGRLLSRFVVPDSLTADADEEAVWIITDELEDPDTATTILWPSDY